MPTLLDDIMHIIEVFIEEGQNTFKSKGNYIWKFLYSVLIFLVVVILILLSYLMYEIYCFFRPVKYKHTINTN